MAEHVADGYLPASPYLEMPCRTNNIEDLHDILPPLVDVIKRNGSLAIETDFVAVEEQQQPNTRPRTNNPAPTGDPIKIALQQMPPDEHGFYTAWVAHHAMVPIIDWLTADAAAARTIPPILRAEQTAIVRAEALNRIYNTDRFTIAHAVWFSETFPFWIPLLNALIRVARIERLVAREDGEYDEEADKEAALARTEAVLRADLTTVKKIMSAVGQVITFECATKEGAPKGSANKKKPPRTICAALDVFTAHRNELRRRLDLDSSERPIDPAGAGKKRKWDPETDPARLTRDPEMNEKRSVRAGAPEQRSQATRLILEMPKRLNFGRLGLPIEQPKALVGDGVARPAINFNTLPKRLDAALLKSRIAAEEKKLGSSRDAYVAAEPPAARGMFAVESPASRRMLDTADSSAKSSPGEEYTTQVDPDAFLANLSREIQQRERETYEMLPLRRGPQPAEQETTPTRLRLKFEVTVKREECSETENSGVAVETQ